MRLSAKVIQLRNGARATGCCRTSVDPAGMVDAKFRLPTEALDMLSELAAQRADGEPPSMNQALADAVTIRHQLAAALEEGAQIVAVDRNGRMTEIVFEDRDRRSLHCCYHH